MKLALTSILTGILAASAAQAVTFQLDTTTPDGTPTPFALDAGILYDVTVSGTFLIADAVKGRADAEYTGPGVSGDVAQGIDVGVAIDGAKIRWGAFDPASVYQTQITGTGAPATFSFVDVPGRYVDNDGTLQVDIVANGDAASPVPLPAGLPMLAGGLGLLALTRRRRG